MKYKLLLGFALISLISSMILSFAQISEVCEINETPNKLGCNAIHNSPYNYTLGLQNSYFGIAIFSFLSLLIYSQIQNPTRRKRQHIHAAVILGSVIALYFIYLQFFIIKALCKYCLIVDFSLLASLVISLKGWNK